MDRFSVKDYTCHAMINDIIIDPEVEVLRREKEGAYDFRKRRHAEWTDNYTLYRNKVVTNRFTQRQSVNIPLMRYALNSFLKEIDDAPLMYFKNLDNNSQKEVFYNEYWKEAIVTGSKLRIRDILDKKNAMLYGRPFKKIRIKDGVVSFDLVDPQNMLIDRFVDPADMDTAMYLIQTGIYSDLETILANPDYTKKGKSLLSTYYQEQNGTLEQDNSLNIDYEKNQRMKDMGLDDTQDPLLGKTKVELNEFYRKEYVDGELVIFVYTIAVPQDSMIILQKTKLCDLLGDTYDNYWYGHYPYVSWGMDPDSLDFWSDSPADILRGANLILNSWFSQLVENRTLRNFGMHYYDASNPDFVPQIWEPEPWGWYGVPGKPSEVLETVEVPDLSESLDEMTFVIQMAEKAVASTSAQSGEVEGRQVTLGEVQLALANAKERIQSTQVFYTESWKEFGTKYIKVLEGASRYLSPVTIKRSGRLGKKMYSKVITPQLWLSKSGYKVEVELAPEREERGVEMLQKLNATLGSMPDNVPLREIYNRKMLDFAGLDIDDKSRVQEFEAQKALQQSNTGLIDQDTESRLSMLNARAEQILGGNANATAPNGIPTQ